MPQVISTALNNISKELEALGISIAPNMPVGSTSDPAESGESNPLMPIAMDTCHPTTFANSSVPGSIGLDDEMVLLDLSYLNGQMHGEGSFNLLDMPPEMYEAFLQIEPLSVTMDPGFDIY